jgi:hypothetical protein
MTPRPKMLALQPSVGASAQAWAARITACWRASVEAILEVGRLLEAAKEALPHGEFGKMVETELPFGDRTAQMLMAIAADPQISNPKFISHLPANWGALYELSTLELSEEQFESGIEKGSISPDLDRKVLIKGARSLMGSRHEPPDSADFFPTPPWATRALLQYVIHPGSIAGDGAWEPACGEGHMAEVLREYFKKVIVSDLYDYGYPGTVIQDFTKYEGPGVDWIITNPPFEEKTELFVLRALELANIGVAMFVRLQWLESGGRYESIFEPHPPTQICFFAERVPLHKGKWEPNGATATAYIWLLWLKGRKPLPPIWISPGQRKKLTYPDDVARFTARPVIRKEDYNPNDSGTNHQPNGTDGRQASTSVSEPASADPQPPSAPVDAGSLSFSESDLPEIILPGKWATFEHVAGFVDLTSEVAGRAS